jgi:hypothetical protein
MTFLLFKNVILATYRRIWVILQWSLHYVTTSEVILLLVVGLTEQKSKHTTGGIPRWSPTLVLVARFSAYVWQSGRDAQFSLTCGRMYSFTTRSFHILSPADRNITQDPGNKTPFNRLKSQFP